MSAASRRKTIVLIPTRDRPGYLALTVRSVLEQASRFGHNVEVVVSDKSRPGKARVNAEMLRKLSTRFGLPVHYYGCREWKAFERELTTHPNAPEFSRQLLFRLAPYNGHWGAHRNQLALQAVFHGGRNADYLHLDDDTPMLELKDGRLRPHDKDVFGALKRQLDAKKERGVRGFAASLIGVRDVEVSAGCDEESNRRLKDSLAKPDVLPLPGGPGRFFLFTAMRVPYSALGYGEDVMHSNLNGLYTRAVEDPAVFVHIGVKGRTFRRAAEFNLSVPDEIPRWMELIDFAAGLHGKARK